MSKKRTRQSRPLAVSCFVFRGTQIQNPGPRDRSTSLREARESKPLSQLKSGASVEFVISFHVYFYQDSIPF